MATLLDRSLNATMYVEYDNGVQKYVPADITYSHGTRFSLNLWRRMVSIANVFYPLAAFQSFVARYIF